MKNKRKEDIERIAENINQKLIDSPEKRIKYKDLIIAAAYNFGVTERTMKEYINAGMFLTETELEGGYIVEKIGRRKEVNKNF